MGKKIEVKGMTEKFYNMLVEFASAHKEKETVMVEHNSIMAKLVSAAEEARQKFNKGEVESCLEEENAVRAEEYRFKKAVEPYNSAIKAITDKLPDSLYAGYVKVVEQDKYGDFMEALRAFMEGSGVDTKDNSAMKKFADSVAFRMGSRMNYIKNVASDKSFLKALKKPTFLKKFLLGFIDVCTKSGLAIPDDFYSEVEVEYSRLEKEEVEKLISESATEDEKEEATAQEGREETEIESKSVNEMTRAELSEFITFNGGEHKKTAKKCELLAIARKLVRTWL